MDNEIKPEQEIQEQPPSSADGAAIETTPAVEPPLPGKEPEEPVTAEEIDQAPEPELSEEKTDDEAVLNEAEPVQPEVEPAEYEKPVITLAESPVIQQVFDTSSLEEGHDNLSQKLFDLTERVNSLSNSTSGIVVQMHSVSEETGKLVAWSEGVQVITILSRGFMIISICILVALLGGISYLGYLQYNAHARLNAAESTLAEALKVQQKRLADYDKHFAELVGNELKSKMESNHNSSIHERLNRLRGGNAEQRIFRKSNGDWFVALGNAEHHIVDHDVIEHLNQLFVKSGRQLDPKTPAPPHKLWGILRSNGHGGTEVIITSEVTS